jgi:biotin carboxyl carrier protein
VEEKTPRFHALMSNRTQKYDLLVNGKVVTAELRSAGLIFIDGVHIDVQLSSPDGAITHLRSGSKHQRLYLKKLDEHRYEVWIKHYVINVELVDARDRLLTQYVRQHSTEQSVSTIRAPMPGIVTMIKVKSGEMIEKGGRLLILEAMKMENEIHSPINGKVKGIVVKEKTAVEKDQVLITIEPV